MSTLKFLLVSIILMLAGCAIKQPGGRTDVWTTASYAEANVIYNGIGFRF